MNASATPSCRSPFARQFGGSLAGLLLVGGLVFGCAQGGGTGNEGSGGETGGGTGGTGTQTGVGGSTVTPGTGGSGPGATGGKAGGTGGMIGTAGTTGVGGRTGTGGTTGAGGAGVVTAYWVSTTGSDLNPGTQAAPFATLGHANLFAKPGVTIWIMPGTYPTTNTVTLANSGTATTVINVFAAPGTRPVLDYAAQKAMAPDDNKRGIDIIGNYWHIRGFEVKNANDNGIAISGSNNVVEDIITDFCGDTGIQITVPSAQAGDLTRGAFNTILNCDSHDNFDVATGGENADGIDAKLDIGPGNVFRGCRSWNNSDDGYDLFGVTQVVTIDNCWAMLNGHTANGQKGPAADGNGFKLGGNNVPAVHKVTNSFALTNDTCGFTLNNNTATPSVTGCGVFGNKSTWCGITHTGDVTITMTTGATAITLPRVTNAAAGASTLPTIR